MLWIEWSEWNQDNHSKIELIHGGHHNFTKTIFTTVLWSSLLASIFFYLQWLLWSSYLALSCSFHSLSVGSLNTKDDGRHLSRRIAKPSKVDIVPFVISCWYMPGGCSAAASHWDFYQIAGRIKNDDSNDDTNVGVLATWKRALLKHGAPMNFFSLFWSSMKQDSKHEKWKVSPIESIISLSREPPDHFPWSKTIVSNHSIRSRSIWTFLVWCCFP